MRKDPTEFRNRFAMYKDGKKPYEAGRPVELPEVVVTPDYEYNLFLNTLPDNQRLTPESEYTTHRYWELWDKPKSFEYTLTHPDEDGQYMYNWDDSDKSYHANSIAYGKDGTGYFMKPDKHKTVQYELDYYNNGIITEEGGIQRKPNSQEKQDWLNFRNEYELVPDSDRPGFHKYKRKVLPRYLDGKPETLTYDQWKANNTRNALNLVYRAYSLLPQGKVLTNAADLIGISPDLNGNTYVDTMDGFGLVGNVYGTKHYTPVNNGTLAKQIADIKNANVLKVVRPLNIIDMAGDMVQFVADAYKMKHKYNMPHQPATYNKQTMLKFPTKSKLK